MRPRENWASNLASPMSPLAASAAGIICSSDQKNLMSRCFSARRTARSCSSCVESSSRPSPVSVLIWRPSPCSTSAGHLAPLAPAPARTRQRQQFAGGALEVELARQPAQFEALFGAQLAKPTPRFAQKAGQARAILPRERAPALADHNDRLEHGRPGQGLYAARGLDAGAFARVSGDLATAAMVAGERSRGRCAALNRPRRAGARALRRTPRAAEPRRRLRGPLRSRGWA